MFQKNYYYIIVIAIIITIFIIIIITTLILIQDFHSDTRTCKDLTEFSNILLSIMKNLIKILVTT